MRCLVLIAMLVPMACGDKVKLEGKVTSGSMSLTCTFILVSSENLVVDLRKSRVRCSKPLKSISISDYKLYSDAHTFTLSFVVRITGKGNLKQVTIQSTPPTTTTKAPASACSVGFTSVCSVPCPADVEIISTVNEECSCLPKLLVEQALTLEISPLGRRHEGCVKLDPDLNIQDFPDIMMTKLSDGLFKFEAKISTTTTTTTSETTTTTTSTTSTTSTSTSTSTSTTKTTATTTTTNTTPLLIELRGGSHSREGNVFINNKPVCHTLWDLNDAKVACRMLGYGVSLYTKSSRFGPVPRNFILDRVDCAGKEKSLLDCGHSDPPNIYCGPTEGAGVVCSTTSSDSVIELRGGAAFYWHKEGDVFINDQPVCDHGWDLTDAYVVCRMFGYGVVNYTTSSNFGNSWTVSYDFILDDVDCTGNEISLLECRHNGLNSHNCDGGDDAGVICTDVELRGGSHQGEGNVFINNQAVCDDDWDLKDAEVVCRMLGRGVSSHTTKSRFGSVSTNFIFDNLACTGTEFSLFTCGHRGIDSHDCGQGEGAGAICSGFLSDEMLDSRVDIFDKKEVEEKKNGDNKDKYKENNSMESTVANDVKPE